MPDRNRLLVCAIGGWLALSLACGHPSRAQENKAEETQPQGATSIQDSDAPSPLLNGTLGIEERREPPVPCTYCAEAGEAAKADREERDLDAQQAMAEAAWWVVGISGAQAAFGFLSVVGLGATVYFARRAADHAYTAAKAAVESAEAGRLSAAESKRTADAALAANALSREALVLERRPWLTVTLKPVSVEFKKDQITIAVKVIAENVGPTPALTVNVFPEIVFMGHLTNIDAVAKEAYRKGIEAGKRHTDRGFTIFPQTKLDGQTYVIPAKIVPLPDGDVIPVVAGVVDYGTMFDTERHQTSFFYLVSTAKKNALNPKMGRLTADQLKVESGTYGAVAT